MTFVSSKVDENRSAIPTGQHFAIPMWRAAYDIQVSYWGPTQKLKPFNVFKTEPALLLGRQKSRISGVVNG